MLHTTKKYEISRCGLAALLLTFPNHTVYPNGIMLFSQLETNPKIIRWNPVHHASPVACANKYCLHCHGPVAEQAQRAELELRNRK